jgi:peptide/nickel transport system permease protein
LGSDVNLLRYVVRRAFFAVLVLLSVITITFVLAHNLGGNPIIAWLGKAAAINPGLAKIYAAKYHLTDPVWVQYYYYLVGIAQGDFGISPSRAFSPVLTVIGETLPLTLQIVFFAFVISLVLGVLFGVLSARYHHTAVDGGIRSFYLVGYSSPPFFAALLLLIVFAVFFKVLPSGGSADPSITTPTWITGLPMLDSLLEGNWAYLGSAIQHAILPSMALALVTFGVITRVLRNSLLNVMNMNYIRTARAKGLDEGTVFFKHALRNGFIPVISLSSVILTWLITSTIFVENVFAYPGLGQYVVSALLGQDYPGILAAAIVFAVTIIVGNFVVDLLYVVVDPQIRLR